MRSLRVRLPIIAQTAASCGNSIIAIKTMSETGKEEACMKKDTFIVLMVIEGFFALIAMGLLFSDMGAIIYLYAAVAFSGVLAPFAIRLKKEEDEAKKRKIRRNMALILLLPIAAGLIAIVLVVIALFMLYA